MSKIYVTTTVNGDPVEFLADPRDAFWTHCAIIWT